MKRLLEHMRRVWTVLPVLLLLVSACAKYDGETNADRGGYPFVDDAASLATGTVKTLEGVRCIQLDAFSLGYVVNPNEIRSIADGTRVFLQYREVLSTDAPDFCTEAILVEWVSPLEMGEIRYTMDVPEGDPVSIMLDWITCLEDGFLTLHYSIPSKGNTQHTFALYHAGANQYEYRLVHEAHGDTEGESTSGIVCFAVGDLLPDTGDETVILSMNYLNIDHTWKTLNVEYRSPK